MKKLQLVIADSDPLYLRSFGEYILSSKLNEKFEIKLFSNSLSLAQYIETKQHVDILLIQPELHDPKVFSSYDGVTVYLAEEEGQPAEGVLSLFKYKPLNQLLSSTLSAYYEHHATMSGIAGNDGKTKVVSVYSPSGGSGKTTFAVSMGRQLAMKGNKVFYLNFELFNSTSLYFQSAEDAPSLQILYYLKARPNQLMAKIEGLKKFDQDANLDYFDLPSCPDEMLSITKAEVKTLIRALIETGQYDYILIDLDSSIHDFTRAAFEESNQIMWLLGNDLQSFYKTSSMMGKQEELFGIPHMIEGKAVFIVNKFTGYFPEEFKVYNLPIHGYLPYVQEWVQITSKNQIYFHPAFSKDLLAITNELTERTQAGVHID